MYDTQSAKQPDDRDQDIADSHVDDEEVLAVCQPDSLGREEVDDGDAEKDPQESNYCQQ